MPSKAPQAQASASTFKSAPIPFCKQFGFANVTWYDKVGIRQLSRNRLVRLELTDRGHQDHYAGFDVKIVNKDSGAIEHKFFAFNDYLSERSDSRKDMLNEKFHGWVKANTIEWYIAVPKSVMPYVAAIESFIAEWS